MTALLKDAFVMFRGTVAAQRGGGFEGYRTDPGGFHRDVLGTTPWEAQIEIAQAVNECDFVTVRSGHGIGKSFIAGGTGLWFLATRPPESIVILTAPTYKQIQEVLWKETRLRYLKAKRSLGGRIAKKAATGLRWVDGRAMFGVTATEAESFAGIRAPTMLIIADESSGVKDEIFTALTGNMAGGAKMLLLGNPTKTSGYFHRSHTTDVQFEPPTGKRIHVPSTRSPNVVAGHIVIPGLVTAEWVEARKIEWGEDSPLYKCRVLGEFVELEEGRVFTNDMIFTAERRWWDNEKVTPKGRLVIGLDPAGESGDGDESAFASRIGKRVLGLLALRGLTPDAHVVTVLGLIREHRRGGKERPLVVVDRDGIIGAKVYAALVAYQSQNEDEFEVLGVRGGERAKRRPKDVNLVRDEVWLNLADAMRDGLELPEDVKLARDLSAIQLEQHISGRSKVTDKDTLRKALGRSPDRGDAVALTAWGRDEDSAERTPVREARAQAPDPYEAEPERVMDPYAALERWR